MMVNLCVGHDSYYVFTFSPSIVDCQFTVLFNVWEMHNVPNVKNKYNDLHSNLITHWINFFLLLQFLFLARLS